MKGVKDCLNVRGVTIQQAKECVKVWRVTSDDGDVLFVVDVDDPE